MAIKIEIFENAIPMLDEIAEINYGMALDALDQAGIVLRDSTRKEFRNSKTNWAQVYIKGNLFLTRTKADYSIGKRMDHNAKSRNGSPASMENLITSYLMAKSMTMVVAGGHKRFTPQIRRNGKVERKGTTVGATTKGTLAILDKLNSGEVDDPEYKKVKRRKGAAWLNKKPSSFFRKQSFIEKGRANAMGRVRDIMTNKLESLVEREINRANVTIVQREGKRA